jgi:hypothetical protein
MRDVRRGVQTFGTESWVLLREAPPPEEPWLLVLLR